MKIIIAMDSFKGSISSAEAGYAVKEGMNRIDPKAEIEVRPFADGGEGTVDAFVYGMNGKRQRIKVTGPLGENVWCEYGIFKKDIAVMEIAYAAGLSLIPKEKRNPLLTTTYGVGEMIKDAIQKGCRRFIVGIGGSATNDGGAGMLQALGYGFLDREGKPIARGARGLKDLEQITQEKVVPQIRECQFRIACDVSNPLCGEKGCSVVYGPQKGATFSMIEQMDDWMNHYAAVSKRLFPKADKDSDGAGAAGGLGFAFQTFLNADLESGVQIVIEETGLEAAIKNADLVITGEGRLDGQSIMGKAPVGIAGIAKKYRKPVIALVGSTAKDARKCNDYGIDAFFPILRDAVSLEQAMEKEETKKNLSDTAEQVFRLWRLGTVIC